MKKIIETLVVIVFLIVPAKAQTLFQTADGDGVIIGIDSKDIYQVKIASSSSSLTAGMYKKRGLAIAPVQKLFNVEAQVKTNNDGVATLLKKGKIKPGVTLSGAAGIRLNNCLGTKVATFLDFYLKPSYQYTGAKLFDPGRITTDGSHVYDTATHNYGCDLLMNFCMFPNKANIFLGVQIGAFSTTNIEDLDEVSIQTIKPIASDTINYVVYNIENARAGVVERITTVPLKIDLIVDPKIHLLGAGSSNANLGFLGYFRKKFDKTNPATRIGFGVCLLNNKNPSKVFSSIGYELPEIGGDNGANFRNGTIFMSIGYTIL